MNSAQNERLKSVLILEDDLQWQQIVAASLKKADPNIAVQFAVSSEAAQSMMDQGRQFDLIVADHFLNGEGTGLNFYKHLRDQQNNASFILVSSLASDDFDEMIDSDFRAPIFIEKKDAIQRLGTIARSELQFIEEISSSQSTPSKVRIAPWFASSMLMSTVLATIAVIPLAGPPPSILKLEPAKQESSAAIVRRPIQAAPNSEFPTKADILNHGTRRGPHRFVSTALQAEIGRIARRSDVK